MKTIMLITLTLASITALLVSEHLNPDEPRYRDKALTAWLNDLNSLDPGTWHPAALAVRAIGSNAIPVLAKRLRARDSFLKSKLIDLCDTYPFMIIEPAESHYGSALEASRLLGPAASRLVDDIIPFLQHDQCTHAVKALVAIGEPAVKPLVNALAHQPARAGAAAAVGSIALQPRVAVLALVPHLHDNDIETRIAVAWALGRFGSEAQLAIPGLSNLTNDSTFSVREQAFRALARIDSRKFF